MRINRQDTNGVKPLLAVGELGYDNYPSGGDAGRVYVGNGTENISLGKKTEIIAVDTKVNTHTARVDNPHSVTKSQVGLGSVPNVDTTNASNIVSGTLSADRLAVSGVGTGTYKSVTVDDKGRVTAGSNPTTLAGYGIADADTSAQVTTKINNAVTALVDASPTTLDTLNELAAALGDDPNFATTTATAIGNRIQKVSSTDNAIVRFDGVTGNVQNSGVVIDDNNNVTLNGTIAVNQDGTAGVRGFKIGYSSLNAASRNWKILTDYYLYGDFIIGQSTTQSGETYTPRLAINKNGNLLVGGSLDQGRLSVYSGDTTNGTVIATFGASSGGGTLRIMNTDGDNYGSAVLTGAGVNKNVTTDRSINAYGTINASGADYAEYEYSNDITITKGQLVGFKVDGTLTDKYNESIRFAIKSTNPSIVGGDTWGIEDIVGKRPEQPVRKVDKTEQVKIEDSEEFETVVIEAGDTDAEWEAIEAKYKAELADFEARLEAERQKVDRIAYAGKVPVNVYGATAGQYIVAIEKDSGIDGLAVNKADMTFAQYQDAVGRVNKILDDGRAEVAVIIH